MTQLGIVTGLAFEAAILNQQLKKFEPGQARPKIWIAGADMARAGLGARDLIQNGATALMSFGIAGGLDPALAPGELVIATSIIGANGDSITADTNWASRLIRLVENDCRVINANLAGYDTAIATAAEKAEMFHATGAVAVDMESLAVALAAQENGIPFCAVRAIADPAQREFPGWVPGAVSSEGKIRPLAVLSALIGRSGPKGNLALLARDSRAAKATLGRVALVGAPGFGLV